ncbi:hypothetical protein [Changchengzhania lutea]|uniref:hypothetical protein n=1 Tax=Changchengzhania lutea TaxID=2049305 RepID=UPI00115D3905|nr:hypothetical protein [Changchengzhania lutea]
MKNVNKIFKNSILALTMCATMLGNANEISSINNKEDLKKTALVISNVKEGDLLSIKDDNGVILYKEFIKVSGTYKKGFDLTALPDGSYFFEVDKDLEIKTIPFTVKSNEVIFDKDSEVTIYKPYTRVKNDIIYVTKLSPNKAPFNIEIFHNNSGDYNLVHSETIENTQTIERIFKLQEGSYKIVYHTDNREFTKFINN